jgi:ribosomal protein L40E
MEAQNVNINSGVKSMVICRHCGAKIAKTAKVCPKCGGKNKKPIYKRWWFIVLAVFLGVSIIGSLGGGNDAETADTSGNNSTISTNVSEGQQTQEPEITYMAYSVAELVNDLDTNALKASEKYKNQYVELTGRLNSIDSNGAHISVYPGVEMYEFQGVTCYIKTPEQKTAVMDMEIGDTVVVKGKITDVGEFLGYYLNIDEVSKIQ